MKTLLTTAAFVLAAGVASASTVTIETSTSGTALKSPFEVPQDTGEERPNIEFGQLFTAEVDATLVSFGFAIDDATEGEDDDFTSQLSYVAKIVKVDMTAEDPFATFDSNSFKTDGYESSVNISSGTNDFDPRDVHVLDEGVNFQLEAGMTYAIVFEAVGGGPVEWGFFDSTNPFGNGDEYAGGSFIYSGSGTNDFMSVGTWDSDFEVTYIPNVIPVAGALPLLATGLAVFGVAGLRRRRK